MAEWLEHEPELLALLATWNDGCSSTAEEEEELAAAASSQATGARPLKAVNSSRERRKHELKYLEHAVRNLEHERDALHARRTQKLLPRHGGEPAKGLQLWEILAMRQFHARRRTEKLNRRLREMLDTQAVAAEALMRSIQRAEQARQEAFATALFPAPYSLPARDDATTQLQLAQRLNRICAQWHLPFARCQRFYNHGNRVKDLYFWDANVIRDDGQESVLDISSSSVYPYARRRVERALWECFNHLGCREEDYSLAMECNATGDSLSGGFRAISSHDGVYGVLDTHFLRRQFRNDQGELVIVSTTRGEPKLRYITVPTNSEQFDLEAVVSEDMWMRVLSLRDPANAQDTSASSLLTVIQHVRRTRIQFSSLHRPRRDHAVAATEFIKRLIGKELQWGLDAVERLLMEIRSPDAVTDLGLVDGETLQQ